jgi:hypothetical protein
MKKNLEFRFISLCPTYAYFWSNSPEGKENRREKERAQGPHYSLASSRPRARAASILCCFA